MPCDKETRLCDFIGFKKTSRKPICFGMCTFGDGTTKIILFRVHFSVFSPVLVFDFQSLYPSVMIAYNICYSTCLGSITTLFDEYKNKKLGVSEKMNVKMEYF